MASLIATHTRSILNPKDQFYDYNCRVRNYCPLHHKCLTSGIVYQATVTNNKDDVERIYYGLCDTAFKEKYRNHTSSFRNEKNRNDRELSNYILALKNDKIVPSIKWKILRIVCGKRRSNYCGLCLTD